MIFHATRISRLTSTQAFFYRTKKYSSDLKISKTEFFISILSYILQYTSLMGVFFQKHHFHQTQRLQNKAQEKRINETCIHSSKELARIK